MMKRNQRAKKQVQAVLACLTAACLLAGCGAAGSSKYAESADSGYDNGYDYNSYDAVASNETAASDELYMTEEALDDADWEMDVADTTAQPEENGTAPKAEELDNSVVSNRKLIRRVNMTAETQEFDVLTAKIESKVKALGGYMESSDIYGAGYSYEGQRRAEFTARVPVDKLDELVTTVGESSNVTNKSESATDITLNYVDTQSRKEALEIEYERLMALLEQADDIETIVALETRLTDVRYELQNLESTLRTYDNLVDYATLQISIEEVKVYTPEVTEPKTAWQRMSEGFVRSVKNIAYDIQDFFIGLVIDLPYLVVWAVIIAVIVLVIRVVVRRRRKKKEGKEQMQKTPVEKMISLDDESQEKEKEEKEEEKG